MNRSLALIATFLIAAPAFAQWPNSPPPKTETKPEAAPPPPPRRTAVRDTGPQGDDGSGFGLGVRAAWAWPMGGLTGSESVSDTIAGAIPLWVEAGYHFNRALYAGLYFQWAPGVLNYNHCLGGQDCSSSDMRFGAEVRYHFVTDSVVQPWVGLGGGYEILNTSRGAGDDRTFKGLELLNVQIGLDIAVGKLTMGPFASYQLLGKFSSFTASGVSNDIADSTGHSWLQAGFRIGMRL